MRARFLDASFFIALLLPSEGAHKQAERLLDEMGDLPFVTTDGVIFEVLAHISKWDPDTRLRGVELVRRLLAPGGQFTIEYTTPERMRAAVDFYAQRLDQNYSLVDCLSMTLMDELGISEILTYDSDFHGEGRYVVLPPVG